MTKARIMSASLKSAPFDLVPGRVYNGRYWDKDSRLVPLLSIDSGEIEIAVFPVRSRHACVWRVRKSVDLSLYNENSDSAILGVSQEDPKPLNRREIEFVSEYLRDRIPDIKNLETYLDVIRIVENMGLDSNILLSEAP